jgi:hypothetical protein
MSSMEPRKKLQSRCRRPSACTLVVLLMTAVALVVANRIEEVNFQSAPLCSESYGWPIRWYRYIFYMGPVDGEGLGWHYDPARLIANLLLWVAMFAAVAVPCEWVLRRYPLRWRWSLRTMLTAVALLAALCALAAVVRDIANNQDSAYATIQRRGGTIWVERWGPKWLDTIGADRFRRRIVGVRLPKEASEEDGARPGNEALEQLLARLAKLPSLRYLSIESDDLDPRMAHAVANMRQLRILSVMQHKCDADGGKKWCDDGTSREWLRAIGGIGKLEHLHLARLTISHGALEELASLDNLKSLSLEGCSARAEQDSRESHLLEHLPVLPRLQAIDLNGSRGRDQDLPALAALPKLRSLGLEETSVTADGVAHLASLPSLEELEIDERIILEPTIRSLRELRKLRRLHIGGKYAMYRYSRAMEALQASNPRIVIDGERDAIAQRLERHWRPPPVYDEPYDRPIRWWRQDDPMLSPSASAQIKKLYPEKALRALEW